MAPCGLVLRQYVKLLPRPPDLLGVSRLTPLPCPWPLPKRPRSRAPSLHRHYPASAVLRAPPTPGRTASPRGVAGCDPATVRVSHVAHRSFPACRSHYPGGPLPMRMTVASRARCGLPRISGGSASATSLSRPAQDSLALRPARLRDRPRRPCVPGASPRTVAGPRRPGSYRGEPSVPRTELPSVGPVHPRGALREAG